MISTFVRVIRITCLVLLTTFAACSEYSYYANAQEMVYTSESGTKYHTSECIHTNESSESVTLAQAVSMELEPCPVCSPPRLERDESDQSGRTLLSAIGLALTAGLLVAIPFFIRARRMRSRAASVAAIRYGDSWESLSRREKKRIITEILRSLSGPSSG